MALIKTTQHDVPSNAIILTKEEAQLEQMKRAMDWTPKTDLWAILYGPFVVGTASGYTGYFVNKFYRKKLKLGRIGHLSSYMPLVAFPAAFTALFHSQAITSNIIVASAECTVCTEIKALAIQGAVGFLYPIIAGPMINYMIASRYNTVRIPMIHIEKKAWWEFHKTTSKSLYGKISYIVALHIIAGALVTHFEYQNMFVWNRKLQEIEDKYMMEHDLY